jgi:serine/threonine protein kinase
MLRIVQLTTGRKAGSEAAAGPARSPQNGAARALPMVRRLFGAGGALSTVGALGAFNAFNWVLGRKRELGRAKAAACRAQLATPPPSIIVGDVDRFGPYQLVERIGEGGMAEVFTALEVEAGDGGGGPLVVKRLRPELCENPVAVAHFLEEGEIVYSLRHPNIVAVRDVGHVDGRHYIAGEYVAGRDLGRLTRRMVQLKQRPLSAAAILHVAHEVLCGLEYAHHRVDADGRPLDLVHRDITPENVMITLDGEVKLLDFGIARSHAAAACSPSDGVKGNVDFMSPEQARGLEVDRRSDLFSLGLVISFCAARAPLYRGKTIYDRLAAAATGPGRAEADFIAGLPPPLPDLLPRALAVDPRRRFQTAAEMRVAIAPFAEGGADELASTLRRVFGDELAHESSRLVRGGRADDDLPEAGMWNGSRSTSASPPR